MTDVEAAPEASPEDLAKILNLARHQKRLELDVAEAEAELTRRKGALKQVSELDLPTAMSAVNLDSLPLGEGWTVELKKILAGSISEANRSAAHDFLEKFGTGGLIKHVITISFGKDEDKWAKKFIADLAKRKKPVHAERKDAVNTTSLGAFIREQVGKARESGLDPKAVLPFDLLGVFELTVAKLVPPKKSKSASL